MKARKIVGAALLATPFLAILIAPVIAYGFAGALMSATAVAGCAVVTACVIGGLELLGDRQ